MFNSRSYKKVFLSDHVIHPCMRARARTHTHTHARTHTHTHEVLIASTETLIYLVATYTARGAS